MPRTHMCRLPACISTFSAMALSFESRRSIGRLPGLDHAKRPECRSAAKRYRPASGHRLPPSGLVQHINDLAHDMIGGDKSPIAAVPAVVAIVAHHEVMA